MTDEARRSTPIASPTSERTIDQSTQSASGLGAERPGTQSEARDDEDPDVVDRDRSDADRDETPRRYEEGTEDPVMPTDDSSLNTKI
jgi:hypothetical protein